MKKIAISWYIATSIFLRIPQILGVNELYKCSKFEKNRNIGRLFLCDLNVFVILCEKEKCEENQAIFVPRKSGNF